MEKNIPVSVTLTGPGPDGLFRIPVVDSDAIPSRRYTVLRVVDKHGRESYGLVTAKHLSDTYTDARGHKVKRISVLPSAPLAWVKMSAPAGASAQGTTYPFAGDSVSGHQPEMLVSRIYSVMNRYVHNTLISPLRTQDSAQGDTLASELVSDTLATLGAPLAFKALHEQSRLTWERSRSSEDTGLVTVPDPRHALWGTCVLWQLDPELGSVSRRTVNRDADMSPDRDSRDWLRVRLAFAGLEVTRCSGGTTAECFVEAPYWSVVLTALCCGALGRWSRALDKLSAVLRIDAHLLSSDRDRDELCQRCGYTYGESPAVCEPEPKRVLGVLQIDKLILGGCCTTLCATVPRNTCGQGFEAAGARGTQRRARDTGDPDHGRSERRVCLNHRRVYRSSPEERCELERRKREQGQGEEKEEEEEDDDEREERRRGKRKTRRGDAQYEQQEPGLWLWQKECRDIHRGNPACTTEGQSVRRERFWDLYLSRLQNREYGPSGNSTSVRYWKRMRCHVLGYHIKTLPFGHRGGPLTL